MGKVIYLDDFKKKDDIYDLEAQIIDTIINRMIYSELNEIIKEFLHIYNDKKRSDLITSFFIYKI